MQQILVALTQVGLLTFVVASMAALGVKLTPQQIMMPLRDLTRIAGMLAANFIIVPAIAILAARTLPMDATPALRSSCSAAARGRRSCRLWRSWPTWMRPCRSA